MLWVEAQILQWVMPDDKESGELCGNSEEAKEGEEPVAHVEGQLANFIAEGHIGARDGVMTGQVAN